MRPSKASTTLAFLFFVFVVLLAFYTLKPYSGSTRNTRKWDVRLEEVQKHIARMASEVHFTGTKGHAAVQSYLLSQLNEAGLHPQLQTKMVYSPKWHATVEVNNVLARIKGTGEGRKALLLLAHYDSAPVASRGASDDISGVAVILETIKRFVLNKVSSSNDIIILFTDAEELGLVGAKGFVNFHPWMDDVGLVLNFEARGSGGPSYMLVETNGGNSNLVRAFNQAAASRPVASSLMYSIYKMLPNDMDMTIFREDRDAVGFNFAFIGDHFDYHTEQDKPERLDPSTVLHQMDYLASTLDHFKDVNLEQLRSNKDAVYFNLPLIGLVIYPFQWVWPMVVLAFVLFLIFVFFGIRRKKMQPLNLLYSVVVYIVMLLVTGVLTWMFWKFMLFIHPRYADILHGFPYNGYEYIGFAACLGMGIWGLGFHYLLRRKSPYEVVGGPVFIWLLINVIVAAYVKGGGYFVVPLLAMLLGLILSLLLDIPGKVKFWIVAFAAVPALLIFSPLVQMFPVGLGLKILFVASVLVVLLLGFIMPAAYYFNMKWLGNAVGVLLVVLLIKAELKSNFNTSDRKQPDGVAYLYNAKTNEAWWISFNTVLDDWLKKVMGAPILEGNPEGLNFMTKYRTKVRYFSKAKGIDVPLSTISYQAIDTLYPGKRVYQLTVTPHRNVHKIVVMDRSSNHYSYMNINGAIEGHPEGADTVLSTERTPLLIRYHVTDGNEVFTLQLISSDNKEPDLEVFEMSFDLDSNPLVHLPPKPEYVMTMPFVNNNAIIVMYAPALKE